MKAIDIGDGGGLKIKPRLKYFTGNLRLNRSN